MQFAGVNTLGTAVTCTIGWNTPDTLHPSGTFSLLEGTGQAVTFGSAGNQTSPACSVSAAASSLILPGSSGNLANQSTLNLTVALTGFSGAVTVRAAGANNAGQLGQLSDLTTYTVAVSPGSYQSGPSSVMVPYYTSSGQSPSYASSIIVLAANGNASNASAGVIGADDCYGNGTTLQAAFGISGPCHWVSWFGADSSVV